MLRLRETIDNKVKEWDKAIVGASEKVGLKLLRDKRRWLCRNDLYYLCCFVGNDEIAKYPEIYRSFCDEVSLMTWQVIKLGIHESNEDLLPLSQVADEKDLALIERLYVCHRVFYKTTIVTKCHSLQLLLNFNNLHVLLGHNKESNASANLVAIKNYFLTTEVGKIFPECVPNTKEWGNMTSFSLANRTDWGRDENSITAVGIDTEITGGHWQVAKKNDLVTEKSVNTEEQIKKTQDWDSRFNMGHFDNPEVRLQDYEGTRYHLFDLYSFKKENPSIKLIEKPLLKDRNPDNLDVKNILNPKRFTPEGIKDMQSDLWVFMCQHMLNPVDLARKGFTSDMIRYFNEIPEGLNKYLLVDPASKKKKKSDYTVMLVIGVDWEGKYYIIDGIRDKLNPHQRINTALELAKKWGIRESGWEETGLGDDNFYLEEKRRSKSLYFTVTPVKAPRIKKEDKIRNILVPQYAEHKWLWPEKDKVVKMSIFDGKNYDLTEEMEHEFTDFPMSKHDDLLDTMTFITQLSIVKPEKVKDKKNREMTMGEYANLRGDREREEAKDPWARFTIGART